MKKLFILALSTYSCLGSLNQTTDLTPILVDKPLPFTIKIETTDITVPGGIHSAAAGQCGCQVLYITGRTNGLHGFDNSDNNFPPSQQNTNVIVINLHTKQVTLRSLYDPFSGLTQHQIDTLSVTSPQSYQSKNTLYITGGYGVDTATGEFSTKDTLTAIDVPGLIHWVTHPECGDYAARYIRQISNPVFKVTGGYMYQVGKNPTLLIFGQNFAGYYTSSSNGDYTQQVRRFYILDNGTCLNVQVLPPTETNPNFRRRDLNVVPIVKICNSKKVPAFVALSGVFTQAGGAWTVPVDITANGQPLMANPNFATTFKQGMNNYICPHVSLLSEKGNMYTILFGGITFEYYQDGEFLTDAELPFTNEITVIKRYPSGIYQQYLLPTQYPTILSTESNPGNQLLFGAGGRFIPNNNIPMVCNGVLNLAKIKKPTVIGYIIGGIESTLPNTSSQADSAASPYVFRVILSPTC